MRAALRDLVVHAVVEPFVAFRIVGVESVRDPGIVDSFRSNYERGAVPRGLESESALIHMGISTYTIGERALATARRWPRIGAYVAQLELRPGAGIWFARTGETGHITVWGRPAQLLACVADILPVGGSA